MVTKRPSWAKRLALASILLLAACGGATTTSTNPPVPPSNGAAPTGTSVGTASPTSGAWPWDAAPPEDHPHVRDDIDADPAAVADGESLGDVASASDAPPAAEPGGASGSRSINPCELVSAAEWSAWTEEATGSSSGVPSVVLEEGDACGWIGPGDRLRMAIAALYAGGDRRWLDPSVANAATPVDGLGDAAAWMPSWPVASSSTLVVQAGPYDLVIEMSSLDANDQLLFDGARQLAGIALERLP